MPFGDYPVFQTPSRGEAIYTRHTSRRLTLPSKVLPCTFTAARAKVRHGSHRIKPKPPRSDLLSFVTLQCLKSKRPGWWGCQVPPELAHSVSTLSASRPEGHLFNRPGLFRPGNTLELTPSRPSASRRGERIPTSFPPMPFGFALRQSVRLRRVTPSGKPGHPSVAARAPACLPGVFPSEALPPAAV